MHDGILDQLFEGVYIVDPSRKITFWNEGAEQTTGYKADEVMGKSCFNNILNHQGEDGTALCFAGCPLKASLNDGNIRSANVTLQHKDGYRVPVNVKTVPITNNEGKITGCYELFTIIKNNDDIITNLNRLSKDAYEDPLTGVSNRRFISSYIESKIHEYKTFGIPFGINFIDIDDFKKVNDIYGHHIGDEVLKTVSATIKNNLRSNDLVARWGGEEFIIVFGGISQDTMPMVSEKMRRLVQTSRLRRPEGDITVTISVGATMIRDTDHISSIIARADELMYQSKQKGKNLVTTD
jgi:diguanylate cyclase (GGDEF)-like protein/PAS domain S-box-containing protein